MAKKSKIGLTDILLFIFIGISILLIVFLWADGIWGGDGDDAPGFVRPTFDDFELGEDVYDNGNQIEATPTKQHRNTHTPEITPTPEQ